MNIRARHNAVLLTSTTAVLLVCSAGLLPATAALADATCGQGSSLSAYQVVSSEVLERGWTVSAPRQNLASDAPNVLTATDVPSFTNPASGVTVYNSRIVLARNGVGIRDGGNPVHYPTMTWDNTAHKWIARAVDNNNFASPLTPSVEPSGEYELYLTQTSDPLVSEPFVTYTPIAQYSIGSTDLGVNNLYAPTDSVPTWELGTITLGSTVSAKFVLDSTIAATEAGHSWYSFYGNGVTLVGQICQVDPPASRAQVGATNAATTGVNSAAQLASTGVDSTPWLLSGATAVALGVAFMLAARRRHTAPRTTNSTKAKTADH